MHIAVDNVSKSFPVTLAGQALTFIQVLRGKKPKNLSMKRNKVAVDCVSMRFEEGERVGIIGHNGAGKTTLLQMIAGLAEPSSGTIDVEGHVNCVMTLGVGLREELSGRENIYIDGELNGKIRRETDKVIDAIVAFADLGEFIDYPVRTYSSGMKARLAFAMIIFIEPEILIIDEALSAGDTRFVAKASAKMKEICNKGKILIVVSHSMGAIVDMCNRCIWMDHGKVVMDGPPQLVTEAYLKAVIAADELVMKQKFKKRIGVESYVNGLEILGLSFIDSAKTPRSIFTVGENMNVRIGITVTPPAEITDIRLCIERTDGVKVVDCLASEYGFDCSTINGIRSVEIPFEPLLLGKNTYEVTAELISNGKGGTPFVAARCREIFRIDNPLYSYENPVCWSPATWTFEEQGSKLPCR